MFQIHENNLLNFLNFGGWQKNPYLDNIWESSVKLES